MAKGIRTTKGEPLPFEPLAMRAPLLEWYAHQGRDLPWRNIRDPYRIWLSEIMLQQTTVAAVIDYYHRFLKRYPDVQSLANASLDDVLTLWAGLGYYSRARNLHKTAQQIVSESGGVFPQNVEQLQQLPGIGRSTAGAIVCLAFDQPEPILDGNVRRVLCRLLAITEPARDRGVEKRLWVVAKMLVPEGDAHDYTQAIMDLGATVCTPKRPDCKQCPLAGICRAFADDLTSTVPVSLPRSKVSTRYQAIVLVECDGQILIRRRKLEGLLGGMLEFPTVALTQDDSAELVIRDLLASYGCSGAPDRVGAIRHTYSHFRLEAEVYILSECGITTETGADLFWHPEVELDRLALHGAHKKALALSRDKRRAKYV